MSPGIVLHETWCEYFAEPPTLRQHTDCNCGAWPPRGLEGWNLNHVAAAGARAAARAARRNAPAPPLRSPAPARSLSYPHAAALIVLAFCCGAALHLMLP